LHFGHFLLRCRIVPIIAAKKGFIGLVHPP
jgi:hypothetical protein